MLIKKNMGMFAIVVLLVATVVIYANPIQPAAAQPKSPRATTATQIRAFVPIAASGSNIYVTWWTNKTGTLMPVFRASNDNGDTFAKAIMLNSTG